MVAEVWIRDLGTLEWKSGVENADAVRRITIMMLADLK